mmetsp:Transcript_27385/g.52152  ORF Transcript_27385/g.52152 Transcript_27385/m.52152 type:complete len:131 (+) Transcript_27385:55-447(+)|eukprot:CAMPEP_0114249238 /NCGR_PEP_ID=MMETSP0058-20121206/14033_1 /TAXON_ID=36894 /ORGANISM="Pyramimonas parkeae, CCMP726" /LENGTH=130 /DNA_ID=CAMNT_0001362765 /DNA_START=55 /DNA_END=447 /DNA_ORIENTATION=-
MSRNGVRMLEKITLYYCSYGGSSRGIRQFIKNDLPALKEKHPKLEVVVEERFKRHPALFGEYVSGNTKEVPVRNEDTAEIWKQFNYLACQFGAPVRKIKRRHFSHKPSIQGKWTAEIQDMIKANQPSISQ